MIAFGPVPSRRLGRSLGVNNILAKTCSYSCIYCQLGCTINLQSERREFYSVDQIIEEVKHKISNVKENNERLDYVTFVPDGEPTLDINLGKEIQLIKKLNVKVAVITNASLIFREDVQADLSNADWVSLKVDAVTEKLWRKINRPHKSLKLSEILEGMLNFRRIFKGILTTETMIVKDINDNEDMLKNIGEFLSKLNPDTAYISTPIRPPAFKWVKPADEHKINLAYQIINEYVDKVELITGYESNEFTVTGDVKSSLLAITAVHPMRKESVELFLKKANVDWSIVDELIKAGEIVELEYGGKKFYVRKLPTIRR